jgi:formamidase
MAKDVVSGVKIAGCTVGPTMPMVGPVRDGGMIVFHSAPGCWGPMITPHLDGGHEVTEPVAVEGAQVGDAIALRIKEVVVTSKATASGTGTAAPDTRIRRGDQIVRKCPQCDAEFPLTRLEGIGEGAIKCQECGAEAIPNHVTCGYTVVFNEQGTQALTVGSEQAAEIAKQADEYAALPPTSKQIPVLLLAKADMVGGILTRMRPFVGNIGTVPAIDVSASCNCGDFGQFLFDGGLSQEQFDALTDGHLDADSVREGAILICPVKVDGGGVYVGDVHAMQGDGEIAGHTTDVSARVTVEVELIKGLALQGPLLLPPAEDLPFLSKPFSVSEHEKGRALALDWGEVLEENTPLQFIGSGPDLNAATQNALERAAGLLEMSLEEVQNRVTLTGAIEIGRAPGLVTATLLAPAARLEAMGILHLAQEMYGPGGGE